ncbi:hypothetical protein KEM52_002333 [Ascosphaera acerosa]|nr:hypothetical protein KEM52_002333 [Ascosphaera acerosa]
MGRIFEAERPFQRGRRLRRRLSDGEKVFCVVVIGALLLILTNSGLVNDNFARSVATVTDYLGFTSSPSSAQGHGAPSQPVQAGKNGGAPAARDHKVPLEAHIMSKCPDAQYCLQELVVPVMERLHAKIEFQLSFIGEYFNETNEVDCMHGPTECIGNILMLCAAHQPAADSPGGSAGGTDNADADDDDEEEASRLSAVTTGSSYPTIPQVRALGFANCLTLSYEDIPDEKLVKRCARKHGIDFDALNRCASRQIDDPDEPLDDPDEIGGLQLMRKSFRRSAELGVTTSCTVRVDDVTWCVRDGEKWTKCGRKNANAKVTSLVEHISTLYDRRNPR